MNLENIAIRGAPEGSCVRLELGNGSGETLSLILLHDEADSGSYARVYQASIGVGEVRVPVAFKVQRDVPLVREQSGSVNAKFEIEYHAHRRLQEHRAETDSAAPPGSYVGRQLDMFPRSGQPGCDTLPPCILCAKATHGMEPLCPRDGTPLREAEFVSEEGRALDCPTCGWSAGCTDSIREEIRMATVQKSAACATCVHRHDVSRDVCRSHSRFFNFFTSHVIAFELLDLDLRDYLLWAKSGRARIRSGRSLPGNAEQILFGKWHQDRADLGLVLQIFGQIIRGVVQLHRIGVSHRDLKPANVCIDLRREHLDVRIIDLGYAFDGRSPKGLSIAQDPAFLRSVYAPPEMASSRGKFEVLGGQLVAGEARLRVDEAVARSGEIAPGDSLVLVVESLAGVRFRVTRLDHLDAESLVFASSDLGQQIPNRELPEHFTVKLEKQTHFLSDIYSLGMILAALLLRDHDLKEFEGDLRNITKAFESESASRLHQYPSRALVDWLVAQESKYLEGFSRCARRLAIFGSDEPLARELLGIALRAIIRGDARLFYAAHRGSDSGTALACFMADVLAVEGALALGLHDREQGTVHQARVERLSRLMAGASFQPAPAPEWHAEVRLALNLAHTSGAEEREHAYLLERFGGSATESLLKKEYCRMVWSAAKIAADSPLEHFIAYCVRLDHVEAPNPRAVLKSEHVPDSFRRFVDLAASFDNWIIAYERLWDRIGVVEEVCRAKLNSWWGRSVRVKGKAGGFEETDMELARDSAASVARLLERFQVMENREIAEWNEAQSWWVHIHGHKKEPFLSLRQQAAREWKRVFAAQEQWRKDWKPLANQLASATAQAAEVIIHPLAAKKSLKLTPEELDAIAQGRQAMIEIRDLGTAPLLEAKLKLIRVLVFSDE